MPRAKTNRMHAAYLKKGTFHEKRDEKKRLYDSLRLPVVVRKPSDPRHEKISRQGASGDFPGLDITCMILERFL